MLLLRLLLGGMVIGLFAVPAAGFDIGLFALLLLIVGADDLLYEAVTHDVRLIELDLRDAFDVLQDAGGLFETRFLVFRQVDLRQVAGDDGLGRRTDTGKEHLDLQVGGVLCLIEDDERIIERTAAHVGERCDLDHAVGHVVGQLIGRDHVVERIVERAQVRVDLLLQVAGEEAEAFAGLHRGTGEDDLAYGLVLEGTHGQGYGGVRFTGTGRAYGKDDVVLLGDGSHELLVLGLGADDLAIGPENENVVVVDVFDVDRLPAFFIAQDLGEIILGQVPVAFQVFDDLVDLALGSLHFVGLSGKFDLRSAGEYFEKRELLFEDIEFTVVNPEELDRVNGFKVDDRFCQLLSLLSRCTKYTFYT